MSTFVCIASGPSLNQQQIDMLWDYKDQITIIGVNDNWRWKFSQNREQFVCDHLYAADISFWNVYLKKINESGFPGEKWIPIQKSYATKNGLRHIKCIYKPGLGKKESLHCNHNSGSQAINLAFHLGAKKIILLGYDMKLGEKGKIHWFGNHPSSLRNTPNKYEMWVKTHKPLSDHLKEEGVEVINATPDSSIPYYKKMNLKEVLSTIGR